MGRRGLLDGRKGAEVEGAFLLSPVGAPLVAALAPTVAASTLSPIEDGLQQPESRM